jgi:signal transduction histidine kinase
MLGLLLARTITRPVRALTSAAQQLAGGNLAQTVSVQLSDEVGALGAAFNQMSADLARADQVRRQMTADIAHELRNPLTVIGGYLDAMRAEDLPPTPARLDAVYQEIQNLEHLVDDLRTLSLADGGALGLNRQPLAPGELLNRVAARYAQQAGQREISLTSEVPSALPEIWADEARMNRVFSNLVSNALRHTSPHGQVRLRAKAFENKIHFPITDTGEGVQPEDLGHVFERFYRGDQSRYGTVRRQRRIRFGLGHCQGLRASARRDHLGGEYAGNGSYVRGRIANYQTDDVRCCLRSFGPNLG